MDETGQQQNHKDAMLVNQWTLSHAMRSVVDETPDEELTFIETEPLLSAFCRAELFQTLGKLAVSGASPKVVRGVGADIHRLITVTATAMKLGYCSLLEDFLPEFTAPSKESQPHSSDEDKTSP